MQKCILFKCNFFSEHDSLNLSQRLFYAVIIQFFYKKIFQIKVIILKPGLLISISFMAVSFGNIFLTFCARQKVLELKLETVVHH